VISGQILYITRSGGGSNRKTILQKCVQRIAMGRFWSPGVELGRVQLESRLGTVEPNPTQPDPTHPSPPGPLNGQGYSLHKGEQYIGK
jgi:hypothetical protein